ncbi:IQ motif and SEC7 domain-containing protein 3 [Clupea harengus]|uniref:IQ motif and SEC7 domain-containing protein 3 n=1 Tax=Clupea harengus TaxID=7950 RepID=A0A8M1KH00_CLUHA|nr:IQ motif and SEC7 domain-containing protein 3 [Clupea harengus]
MASLLENPVQAVLYLKELTAIVQNQQSLIQTQRVRIDLLERKLDDLVVENKQLRERETNQPPHHHHHPPHHHHPAQPGQLPQAEQAPSAPQQEMQLVPASTLSPSPEDSPEDAERRPDCKALIPQTQTPSSTLTRTGARAHTSESQTVLHQFCCPAPEAQEREAICCSESPTLAPSGGEEEEAGPKGKASQPDASTCAHPPQYEHTADLEQTTQMDDLERKYGGPLIARRAARKIQTAFRQYQLSRNYEKIRTSMSERREPRRMSVRRMRLSRDGFSAEQALMEGCKLMGIPLTHSASAPACSQGTLTNLEDTFTEQVQSLARSIDEALSSWSTVGGLSGEGDGDGVADGGGGRGEGPLVDPPCMRENLPRSASKLMLAFRDVTVQIDNRNYRLSSSAVLESVALGSTSRPEHSAPQGPAPEAAGGSVSGGVQSESEPDFPAPPSREEMEEEEGVDGEPPGIEAEVGRCGGGGGSRRPSQTRPEGVENSTSTPGQSETMVLSLPRPHCQDTPLCGTLSTDTGRKRLYRIGLNLFNLNPDKGIEFLISRGFIPDTPIGVAHFLLQRKGLSRQMIGEFLGNSKKQFNRDVLDCVVDEMDFSGLELDEALRKFQAHIRVQGEAQKVERLIEAFSQRYCMCNPDVVQQFHNPDTIFILAFAVVLLNTDMYSPNIKPERKMLLEDFIRNLRGVDDGADIPRDMVAGIYERIQQRELRSNEDHVTYVSRVEQSILGMKTILAVPHRRLVCCSRLYEVTDVNKPQKQASHQREVFLFNDLLVILKLCPKKKSAATYTFCKAMGLLGMQFHLFENEYYPHGITVLSPFCSEKRQVVSFSAPNTDELLKFVEDLRESITEVAEMENIRIEWELERQHGIRSQPAQTNQSQMEIHIGQGIPTGNHEYYEKSGNNTVEVSIHNRLQTYQLATSPQSLLSSPATPLAGVHPLAVLPSVLPPLSPLDTLIQCQQIVKVIVVDATGRGRVEAFLSHSPAHHRLIQSADSSPSRSRESVTDGKGGSNPPLPPPPPPYHHPHQYCPPTPPPQHHLLSRHRALYYTQE